MGENTSVPIKFELKKKLNINLRKKRIGLYLFFFKQRRKTKGTL